VKSSSKHLPLPDHIKVYAADFRWDNELLWKLSVPTTTMNVAELVWHFDIPWLHTEGQRFNVRPAEIMQNPELFPEQYLRTMQSDLSYPIDILFNKGNWLILDGLHRLMKSALLGKTEVQVRKIPQHMIPYIAL
jgi:hypothetical protein